MIPTTISVGGFTEVDPTAVHKTGAETVAGVKTFSSAPVVPDGSFTEAKTVGLIPVTQKAATSGVASLDTSGWVPPTQLGNSAPVNVKSRGATGLGVADDYTALQNLIAAGNVDVLFPPGTYNISNTLTPGPNTNITFADGAVLRGHSTVSGTLDSAWRHIYVNGVDNVTIIGLTLGTPLDTPVGIGGLELGIMVYVVDSTNVRIEGGVADWNSYANHPAGALNFCWFKGTSKYCRVTGCYLTGIGITYSYAGASHIECSGNTIISARGNALSGTGNGAGFNEHCQVLGNTIVGGGRMGIEDFDRTRYTVIRDNYVSGVVTMGISAVGRQSLVQGNTVVNAGDYGIETPAAGGRIIGNDVRWTDAFGAVTQTAIGVNSSGDGSDDQPVGVVISGCRVENANIGVLTISTPKGVVVTGCEFVDIKARGIDLASVGSIVTGCSFRYQNVSSGVARYPVYVQSTSIATAITGCSVRYEAATTGSTGGDHGFLVQANGTTLTGCSVRNEKTSGGIVYSVATGGATPTSVAILGCTFIGCDDTNLIGTRLFATDQTGVNPFVLNAPAGQAANLLRLQVAGVDKISMTAAGQGRFSSLGVGNSSPASVGVGTIAKKIEIYDSAGTSLGFIPVYSTIT